LSSEDDSILLKIATDALSPFQENLEQDKD
jgi:hypothetical protein